MDDNGERRLSQNDISPLHYGSLCTGIGGLDLAVEAHFGAVAAWHSEIDEAAATIAARHWPGVPNAGDLTALDWGSLEPVDIITAGYPCQPFSSAGKRKGKHDDRHLWPYVAAGVRALRPRWVVLENVRNHLALGFGDVLRDLAESGFDAEWCLLRASDVGAPHQRARVFIVASDTEGQRRAKGRRSRAVQGLQVHGRSSIEPRRCGDALPADADRHGLAWLTGSSAGRDEVHADIGGDPDGCGPTDWGHFGPAIRRWERRVGRPAPRPVTPGRQLSPAFVEWMQGYPQGWVRGQNHNDSLRLLGNAVVPQQGLAALRELVPEAVANGAAA